jgi:hypothetical protein
MPDKQRPDNVEPAYIPVGAPIKAGKHPKKAKKAPGSLNERHLVKAQMLSDSLFKRRGELLKQAGEPFKSGQLTATERKTQYKEMIASPELLMKALSGAAIVGRDGRLRISNKMVDAFRELSGA